MPNLTSVAAGILMLVSVTGLSVHVNAQMVAGPVKVEVARMDGKWTLMRGGEPYYVKGIGPDNYLERAAAYGANSVRTWGTERAQEALDAAQANGMTVLLGLWVGQERQGFDYNDSKAVKAQLEGFREVVRSFKDHPALLMWGVGNECDLFYTDLKVWNAIDDIAKMIHEEDGNHPTMTVTAGLDVAEVQLIKERAPNIDVYGINTYSALLGISKEMRMYGWDGPYMIAEWGPNGHWEVPKTAWGAPIEQTSSEKAASYQLRYNKGIAEDPEMCVGSYAFLWGQKQETTGTWYGVFLEDGTETEVVDVLEHAWSGKWPENRSPHINSLTLDGLTAYDSPYVKPGATVTVIADAYDPEQDDLRYSWELLPESTDIKSGGDAESRPESMEIIVKAGNGKGKLDFRAPVREGAYRLFTVIYDGNGNAATANCPFYVRK